MMASSMILITITLCALLPMIIAQYETMPHQGDSRQNYNNRPPGPMHYQYSSVGSPGFSSESNSVYHGSDAMIPYSGRTASKQLPIARQQRILPNSQPQGGISNVQHQGGLPNIQHQGGLSNIQNQVGLSDVQHQGGYEDDFHGPRYPNGQPRNYRYQESIRSTSNHGNGRQTRTDRPWQSAIREEYRSRQKYPRNFISRREDYHRQPKHYQIDGKMNTLTEIKRNPRIVKYVADKNGFAVREDLIKPLQNTIDKVRQESKRRILTVAPSGPPQNSLMSQVVTSAIQVAGNPSNNSGIGKFLPKIFDMKNGKRSNQIDRLPYSMEKMLH